MEFSNRTDWQTGSNPLSQKFAEKKDQREPILDLTLSNPTRCDFNYPKSSLIRALMNPKNLHYEPHPKGLIEARKTVSRYYARKKIIVDPEQIFLTGTTSEAYGFILRLLCNPGDSVAAPKPSYPLFDYLCSLNDVVLDRYRLNYNKEWSIDFSDLNSLVHSRTKALILVNPNNPTGHYVRPHEKEALNRICQASGAALIADEVFLDFNREASKKIRHSFADNASVLTFTLSGISKILALPQMKLAWIVVTGPKELTQKAIERLEVISDTYLSVNTPTQRAFPGWLAASAALRRSMMDRLLANSAYLRSKFHAHSHVEVLGAEAGWYAVLKITGISGDGETWALDLLENYDTFVHPGYFFDFEEDTHLVLSLLPAEKVFKKGVDRIFAFAR